MKRKIILSADSACDIGEELQKEFDVRLFDFHIQVGDRSLVDGKEISPEEIFLAWRENGILPKTAAIPPSEYESLFKYWVNSGFDVLHFSVGSNLSVSYQNAVIAASEMRENVFIVDSANLSAGIAMLIIKAREMINSGMPVSMIADQMKILREKSFTSFVLDTLEFMAAGGRCSAVLAFGANLLELKPGIEVDNTDGGSMDAGKKYRGKMKKVLPEYVAFKLKGRDDLDLSRIFITHSGSPQEDIDLVKKEILRHANFSRIHVTRTGGTIASHCGPRTLGIVFMTR